MTNSEWFWQDMGSLTITPKQEDVMETTIIEGRTQSIDVAETSEGSSDPSLVEQVDVAEELAYLDAQVRQLTADKLFAIDLLDEQKEELNKLRLQVRENVIPCSDIEQEDLREAFTELNALFIDVRNEMRNVVEDLVRDDTEEIALSEENIDTFYEAWNNLRFKLKDYSFEREYNVSVTINGSVVIEAGSQGKAQELAENVVDDLCTDLGSYGFFYPERDDSSVDYVEEY